MLEVAALVAGPFRLRPAASSPICVCRGRPRHWHACFYMCARRKSSGPSWRVAAAEVASPPSGGATPFVPSPRPTPIMVPCHGVCTCVSVRVCDALLCLSAALGPFSPGIPRGPNRVFGASKVLRHRAPGASLCCPWCAIPLVVSALILALSGAHVRLRCVVAS